MTEAEKTKIFAKAQKLFDKADDPAPDFVLRAAAGLKSWVDLELSRKA